MIHSILHCAVQCSDFERSLAFYELLGFRAVSDFRGGVGSAEMGIALGIPPYAKIRGAHIAIGGKRDTTRIDLVEFIEPKIEGAAYPHLHHRGIGRICLHVDHLEDLVEELQSQGVRFLSDIQIMPGGRQSMICCQDPDGIFIQLLEGAI